MLERLNPYLPLIKIAAVVLAVIAAVWWWNSHNAGQQQVGYGRCIGDVAAKQAEIAEEKRIGEIEDQKLADQEAKYVQEKLTEAERQLVAARADTDRMRGLYRQAAERGRQAVSCVAGAGEGKQGSDPIGVLAELLERADARAEEVAGYADRLRVAGESCERIYDGVTGQ